MTIRQRDINQFETVPSVIPVSGEDICVKDARLFELHLLNQSESPVTVRVMDKQPVPMPIVPTQVLAPGTDAIWQFTGRLAPGGIHWSASVNGAAVGYARWH